jgi:hypothetical protein
MAVQPGATQLYRALIAEFERQRIEELGISRETLSEVAGLGDRHYNKLTIFDRPCGRQAQWATIQNVVDVLYPDGFDLRIVPRQGPRQAELLARIARLYPIRHPGLAVSRPGCASACS